ncbi:hypothetical protein FTX61_08415 [Nitriliruptoraceae bacterium ZYF776]|nr:hypothetical protein [Profundirhabdus halotolerans]
MRAFAPTACEDAALPRRDEAPPVHAARDLTPPTGPPVDGTVLVRIPVSGRGWARALPPVPDGGTLTVTLGHADLAPVPVDDLVASGYRIAGVAADHRPLGAVVDVLVPPAVRDANPVWWAAVVAAADRVFDLRLGPVARVLAAEIALHQRASRAG